MKINLGKKYILNIDKCLVIFFMFLILIGVIVRTTGGDWFITFLIPISLLYLCYHKGKVSEMEEEYEERLRIQERENLKQIVKEILDEKEGF